MAITPGKPVEKFLHNLENFKEKTGQTTEKERIKKLEEARKSIIEDIAQGENMTPATIGPVAGVMAPQSAGWRKQKQIESILSKGLEDIYLNLTPERQKKFKQVGEETVIKINNLLNKTKVNIGAIIKLIRKWLALIPGINKYFLEQEAKIRADEIIKLNHEL